MEAGGHLIASLVAESSEYGVVSGNLSNLERTLRSLLRVDRSIYKVEVLDSTKQPLVRITSDTVIEQGSREFEVAIKREVVSVDLDDQPHDTQNAAVGYVRVRRIAVRQTSQAAAACCGWRGNRGKRSGA